MVNDTGKRLRTYSSDCSLNCDPAIFSVLSANMYTEPDLCPCDASVQQVISFDLKWEMHSSRELHGKTNSTFMSCKQIGL